METIDGPDLHAEVRRTLGTTPLPASHATGRVVCPRFVIDGTLVRTITVAATFESVADVTLDEVRVELIYPEDDASDRFFRDTTGLVPGGDNDPPGHGPPPRRRSAYHPSRAGVDARGYRPGSQGSA